MLRSKTRRIRRNGFYGSDLKRGPEHSRLSHHFTEKSRYKLEFALRKIRFFENKEIGQAFVIVKNPHAVDNFIG